MNIKRAKEEIKDALQAYFLKDEYDEYVIPVMRQRPILLLGAPGIGKTQIMEQIAKECQVGLVSYTITHHTRQSAIGLPFISKKDYNGQEMAVTEYTMSEIVASVYDKIEKTKLQEGILFIDEINCVSETLAPAMLQFLQCKTFGNHAIPQGWLIVAAGNPPEYNKSVREFDVVTMDRIKKIEVEPDYEVWKEYAYQEQIHLAIISYLNTRSQYFYMMEQTIEGKRFATPRGWEDLSRVIQVYEKLGKTVDREVIVQYIQHPKPAKDFANYLELYYKYQTDYQIEAVFEGKFDDVMIRRLSHAAFDERLSVVGLLLARVFYEFELYNKEKNRIRMIFGYLKECKDAFAGVHGMQPFVYLEEVLRSIQKEWEYKKEAEILTRKDADAYRQTISFLENAVQDCRMASLESGEEVFGRLRELFQERKQIWEAQEEEAGKCLEYAFDFMEIAFLQSQEMVIFITELNRNAYSIDYLKEHEHERYYQHNRSLLFEERNRILNSKIDKEIASF